MTYEIRDRNILIHMLDWCGQLNEAHDVYDRSREKFGTVSAYRNAVSMCIFQICELANHLSDGFKAAHSDLPWNQIRGMRNLFAHDYGNMDVNSIWETACGDIPPIERFCRRICSEPLEKV